MELKVYRSKVTECIVIETGIAGEAAFKLFDDMGNLVLLLKITDGEQISVHDLRKGLYHYKLIAGESLQVGKIDL